MICANPRAKCHNVALCSAAPGRTDAAGASGTVASVTVALPKASEQTGGSLVVVGSGIRALQQMPIETRGTIASADKVFYAVRDPITEGWITKNCATSENLVFYAEGKDRLETYDEMIDAIMNDVRAGLRVCAVF